MLAALRENLIMHGARGIFGIGRKFRVMDDDHNGKVDFLEFKKAMAETIQSLRFTDPSLKELFDFFDKDHSGAVSFDEFLNGVRGPMPERRKAITMQAFAVMDADHNGVLEVADLIDRYDSSQHPAVLSGTKTERQVLKEFLQNFELGDMKDGKVTPAEWCSYYDTISASIDDDDYFELMMRNCFHLSGGEGVCENTTCRRVLVTDAEGHETVAEVKNDFDVKPGDKEAMKAHLAADGITAVDVGLHSAMETAAPEAAAAAAPPPPPPFGSPRKKKVEAPKVPVTADMPVAGKRAGRTTRRQFGAGESSIVFG